MSEEDNEKAPSRKFVILGGGPAGLSAAYELVKNDVHPIVIEKMDKVGGIARTESYSGYFFDMGGHRFYTKSEIVNHMWQEVLGDDLLLRPRLSRIFYNKKFFYYPLKPVNALAGLGLWQSILVVLSYIRWQLFPYKHEISFEQWVTNRFGKRLFTLFFKSYTEKVWGMSTTELSADFAAQRIKDLDLKTAILSMFIKPKNQIKTLIEEFHYPRRGPGMLWETVKSRILEKSGEVLLKSNVCRVHRNGDYIESVTISENGQERVVTGTDFISSIPITEFIKKLTPPPSAQVLEAVDKLSYRDFLTVCLIIDKPHLFEDNWIYIHDPQVKVGRIQNFKNWSPDMVPDHSKTSLGLEYFCYEGDELWNASENELIELGKQELEKIGLAKYDDVISGCVYRVEKAYPVYDSDYSKQLAIIQDFIKSLKNFQTIGRNGLHRYNNQDHAVLTGILAVHNALFGEKNNLWNVNADQEYLEAYSDAKMSAREVEKAVENALSQAFMKIDPRALGLSLGAVTGSLLLSLTLIVFNNNWNNIADKLWLLGTYFPGYGVYPIGSILGLFYGFLLGFIIGWVLAIFRNATVLISMAIIHRRAQIQLLRKILDF